MTKYIKLHFRTTITTPWSPRTKVPIVTTFTTLLKDIKFHFTTTLTTTLSIQKGYIFNFHLEAIATTFST